MATKRKSISQLKSGKKQIKKLNEEEGNDKRSALQLSSNSTPLCVENCDGINVGESPIPKLSNEPNHGEKGTIISFFRKQKQEAKSVCCPMCERMVLYHKINEHLDGGCSEEFLVYCENYLSTSKSELCNKRPAQLLDKNRSKRNNGKVVDCLPINNDHLHNGKIPSNDTIPSILLEKTSLQSCERGENDTYTDLSSNGNTTTSNIYSDDGNPVGNSTSNVAKTQVLDKKHQINANEKVVKQPARSINLNNSIHTISNSKLKESMNEIENWSCFTSAEQIIIDDVTSVEVNIEENFLGLSNENPNNSVLSENDKTQVTNMTNDGGSTNFHEPYYLQNFMLSLNTVLSHDDDRRLFDESDDAIVKSFQNLSVGAKKLYVRLFQRKFKWFQKVKVVYPRIGDNLEPFFKELINCGFLETESNLHDLEIILNLLPASDIQDLAKSMHIMNKNEGRTKKQLMHSLITHGTKQRSLFAENGNEIAKVIAKRAKISLGPCVKLESFPRNVFSRVLLLFTLNLLADDDDNTGSQLSALFLINIGRIVYPSYEISRETPIFRARDELIKYEVANRNLCRMDDAMENKNFDEARNIFENNKREFIESLSDLAKDEPRLLNSVNLPIHLRRFTCTWLYTRMCSKGVELLQRDREYIEAVELLRRLLGQNEFCVSRRGWWWERLTLNLDQHLKKPSEALEAVKEGLSDIRVRTGHRFALEQRAKKICEAKRNSSLRKHLTEISFTELKQPRVVTISGKRLSNEPVFVLHEVNTDGSVDDNVVSYCGVEEMALRYYRQQGYNEGIHGEGSTFNTLFGLLMWDVIFAEGIPDVFRTPFQAAPLDIYCDNFYANRKEMVQKRLSEIRNASVEELVKWIECTWVNQQGKTCIGINWDLFSGVEQIKELTRCIGSSVLAGICERFAKDYRHTRSGLPDLVVWSSSSLKYKIVEVKGPNDRLSTKQHVWLDVLVSLGVDAEVLYVKAVGGRTL